MNLHENKEDFTEAVQAVSRGLNISPALVEKDYYVTLVLKRLNEELSGLIFKGGTSLSKCHKAINRFSEDIDLTLDSEHLKIRLRKTQEGKFEKSGLRTSEDIWAKRLRCRCGYHMRKDVWHPTKHGLTYGYKCYILLCLQGIWKRQKDGCTTRLGERSAQVFL